MLYNSLVKKEEMRKIKQKRLKYASFLNFSTFLVLLYFIDIVKINKQRIKINFIDYSHSIVAAGLEEIS